VYFPAPASIILLVTSEHGHSNVDSVECLTKQVAKGGAIAFFGQVIGKFFTLLLQIVLTRVLGPAGYGLYALGFSVLGIAQTLSMLGLQNGVVRFGAMYHGSGDKARLKGTLLLALVLSFSSAWLIALMLYFLSATIAQDVFNEPALTAPLRVFAFALPFSTLVSMTSFSARALRRIDYDVLISQISRPLSTLLFVSGSFLLGYRLTGALAGFLASTVLSAALGLYLLHHLFPELTVGSRAHYEVRTLLLYSLPLLLVGLSSLLITRTDRIMLGILGSVHDVGIYNAAAMLAGQATLFMVSLTAMFSPIIADLFNQRRMEELGTLFKTTTKWIFTLTLPLVLVFILFAQPIMKFFGPEFSSGAPVLIALGIAELVDAGVGPVWSMLTMTGRQKLELMNSLALGGLNVFLNFLLIPKYGILGAGVATGLSVTLVNLARLIEVYLLYQLHPYKFSYWKPLVSGVVTALVWLGIRQLLSLRGWLWVGGVVLVGVIYMSILIALGLDDEDRLVLCALRKRILGY